MDWVGQAAAWLRGALAQPWLEAWQPTIARTPDWALLAATPTVLLLFALTLRLTWPWSRTSVANANAKTKPPPAPKQSPQSEPTLPRVEPAPVMEVAPIPFTPAPKPLVAEPAAALTAAPAPTANDDEDNRSVRVFVSSTFLDMQTERDELVTKAFPALRAKYRARGVEVFEVDLRWGITKEQQERGETLPTLLAEIDRCRPYFIGLLGDRYGWVPPAASLTDKLRADYPVIANSEGASVTAIEIMHGMLSSPEALERALFFERDPGWDWIAALNDTDRAAVKDETDADRANLADLKAMIRRKARVKPYAQPKDLQQKVTDALDALLEARFPDVQAPDVFEQDARLHRAYARERSGLHVGADAYVRDLERWMQSDNAPPLLITGASGGGKSTLVVNWLHAWRDAHPEGRAFVFEHFLGASPESANPVLLMRRLWEHLNRATGETTDLPAANAELMDVAAGLTQRLAQARVATGRSGAPLLIALDGLDKLSSEQNLRWLPIVPGVHLLVSSLDGEAKNSAITRGFAQLEIKPLSKKEQHEFIAGTLKRWRRELEPRYIARILEPAAEGLAGSPLYLKTVLEELRVSADNTRLADRLEDYRGARDMANLFDRVLARLEADCEPGLVAKTLPLIWASRAGLEEAEIIVIANTKPLFWATLRNGLGDSLCDQQGRLVCSHEYLSKAVETRYLDTDDAKCAAHLAIADRFAEREPDKRQAEELPFQLQRGQAWDRLEVLLTDINRLSLLRARGDTELLPFWRSLQQRGCNAEELLCSAFGTANGDSSQWSRADILRAFEITKFLEVFASPGELLQHFLERVLNACARLWGPLHTDTLAAQSNLALILAARGDLAGAQKLLELVADANSRVLGVDHPDTLKSLGNLGRVLSDRGNFVEAQALLERVLDAFRRNDGEQHPHTLTTMTNLGAVLVERADFSAARSLYENVLEARVRLQGPEHRETLTATHNLAQVLMLMGELSQAQELSEQLLDVSNRILGPEHPETTGSMSVLASVLSARGDHGNALDAFGKVFESRSRLFGYEHPSTIVSVNNLARALQDNGDFTAAQDLLERAQEVARRTLGPDHPNTLTIGENLAEAISAGGDHALAKGCLEHVLARRTLVFGPNHKHTVTTMDKLAQVQWRAGDFTAAQELYQRALDIGIGAFGGESAEILSLLENLADVLRAGGDIAGAQDRLQQLVAVRTRVSGRNSKDTLRAMQKLARARYEIGDLAGAQELLERALELGESMLGVEHAETLTLRQSLAETLRSRGDVAAARELLERLLAARTRLQGPDHRDTLMVASDLARTLLAARDIAAALPHYERVAASLTQSLGADHLDAITSVTNLAGALRASGDLDRARSLYERVLEQRRRLLGPEDIATLTVASHLAEILRARGDLAAAEKLYTNVLEIFLRLLGPAHSNTQFVQARLSKVKEALANRP